MGRAGRRPADARGTGLCGGASRRGARVNPRGCVLWLLTFGAFVLLVLWFALPPVAGGLAAAALESAGFHGTNTRVDVGADPPLKLLLLDADRIRIRSS